MTDTDLEKVGRQRKATAQSGLGPSGSRKVLVVPQESMPVVDDERVGDVDAVDDVERDGGATAMDAVAEHTVVVLPGQAALTP